MMTTGRSSRAPLGRGVAILLQDLMLGGAERTMITLAGALANAGVATELVVVRAGGPLRDSVPAEVPVVDLGSARVALAVPALLQYLRRARPAVVLSALPHVNVLAVLAARLLRGRPKVVITEHTVPSYARIHSEYAQVRWAYRLAPFVYPLADHIVSVSNGVALDLKALLGRPAQVSVIHNPIPEPTEPPPRPAHSWYNAGGPPVIVAVGRLVAVKDHITLIRAIAILRRRRDLRCVIVGEGPFRERLIEEIQELELADRVALVGSYSDPGPWLAHSAALVSTSLSESFGNVLVEAMYCGTPVVATDCPVGPREILAQGEHGVLVPVANPAALAEGIERVLSSPRPAEQLRRRAADFGTAVAVGRYMSLLETVAGA